MGYLGGMYVYAVSKLCNILFTLELSKRLKGCDDLKLYRLYQSDHTTPGTNIQTFSLRTGGVATDLHDSLFGLLNIRGWMLTPEVGARTSLYCATEPSLADPKFNGRNIFKI